jgi:hypothetical protein
LNNIQAKIMNDVEKIVFKLQQELTSIINDLFQSYREICNLKEVIQLGITEKEISEDMRLRIKFEMLCFSSFCASLIISNYYKEESFDMFNGFLAKKIIDISRLEGMQNLKEIVLRSIEPDISFGFGQNLDPLRRLEEYRYYFVKNRGSELERFGRWIGKALDADHYPLFDLLGGEFGVRLLLLTNQVIKTVLS